MSLSVDPFGQTTVTEVQRDRALDFLQQAYAQGAIDAMTFEERVAIALRAKNRNELNRSLSGVARVAPAGNALARTYAPAGNDNLGAGFTNLSPLIFGFFGPLVIRAAAKPNTRVSMEAGRALVAQLSLSALMVFCIFFVAHGAPGIFVVGGFFTWLATTIVMAVRAFSGKDSIGFLSRFVPFMAPDSTKPDRRTR